jgi:hypothetical protein
MSRSSYYKRGRIRELFCSKKLNKLPFFFFFLLTEPTIFIICIYLHCNYNLNGFVNMTTYADNSVDILFILFNKIFIHLFIYLFIIYSV